MNSLSITMIVGLEVKKVGMCKAVILVEAKITNTIKETTTTKDRIVIPTTIINTINY